MKCVTVYKGARYQACCSQKHSVVSKVNDIISSNGASVARLALCILDLPVNDSPLDQHPLPLIRKLQDRVSQGRLEYTDSVPLCSLAHLS